MWGCNKPAARVTACDLNRQHHFLSIKQCINRLIPARKREILHDLSSKNWNAGIHWIFIGTAEHSIIHGSPCWVILGYEPPNKSLKTIVSLLQKQIGGSVTYHESSPFYGKTSLLWHQEAPTGAGWSRDADVARPVRIIDDHTRTIGVIHWGLFNEFTTSYMR